VIGAEFQVSLLDVEAAVEALPLADAVAFVNEDVDEAAALASETELTNTALEIAYAPYKLMQ
jgi:hypothetical protein